MDTKKLRNVGLTALLGFGILCGCVSADISAPSSRVALDDESMDGGISSSDIRTVATQMCPAILAVPEIAEGVPPVRIKMAQMKNSSRFFIDRDLFMKRLSVELNRYGGGQVRFMNNNSLANEGRKEMLRDRQSAALKKELQQVAKALVATPTVANAQEPVKVALVPVLNANMVNLNADSFAAMLRSEIANASNGKVVFLMPGETEGADYWLTGQFYPESMKTEGIINLADYIRVIDDRIKDGKSLYLDTASQVVVTPPAVVVSEQSKRESILLEMLRNPALHATSDVNKYLNVMMVRPQDKVSIFERTVLADRKITDNSGAANYLLSGEISGLTQSSGSKTSDYLLITMQLIDPEMNEVLWEDAYEVKRVTASGVVYR